MNGYLLDACALIALLNDEPGAERVELILTRGAPVVVSAINALEVAYDAVRRSKNRETSNNWGQTTFFEWHD